MRLLKGLLCLALLSATVLTAGVATAVLINEIRIDQPGTDVDEYFELMGTPLESLAGLTYLVIGDGTGACGVIENVIDLSPYSIQADGYFAACKSATPALTGYDVVGLTTMNFENSDNVTHVLVSGFSGTNGQDLDTNDDGVLDVTPWTAWIDGIGLDKGTVPNCAGEEYLYGGVYVGPDGTFVPGHVFRCDNGWDVWNIGPFDIAVGYDTPGRINGICAVGNETDTWGGLKSLYR